MDQKRMRKRIEARGHKWLDQEPYYNQWRVGLEGSEEVKLFKTLKAMDQWVREQDALDRLAS